METRIVEINGQKFEVDLRTARKVEEYKVGMRVKVLRKTGYGTPEWKVFPGVIAGFDDFKTKPTILICYLDIDHSQANVRFLFFNEDTQDAEIAASYDNDKLLLDKSNVLKKIDLEVNKKLEEIQDLERKRSYFLRHFNQYFTKTLEG